MPRFFTDTPIEPNIPFVLTDDAARHISFSLRMRVGERLVVCANGRAYDCVINGFTADSVTLIAERECDSTEPIITVSMYIAVPKGDKLDLCIQKCVELGATEIIPFWSEHCVTKGGGAEKKGERRSRIAAEAAKQCGRAVVPQVLPIMSFAEALERGSKADLSLFCSEKSGAKPLSALLKEKHCEQIQTISVFSGPEGGFAEKEFDNAEKIGYNMITLGKRILRCETAPMCVLSALMFAFGEF